MGFPLIPPSLIGDPGNFRCFLKTVLLAGDLVLETSLPLTRIPTWEEVAALQLLQFLPSHAQLSPLVPELPVVAVCSSSLLTSPSLSVGLEDAART